MDQAQYLAGLLDTTSLPNTPIQLPNNRRTVDVLTLLRRERRWAGPTPDSFRSVPNKPALEFDQQPIWAEFILLRLLEADGWAGTWVKNFQGRREFWRNAREPVELPSKARELFQKIANAVAPQSGGCWDIFAFRDGKFLFIESKQHKQDSISLPQKKWMESALELGVSPSSFAIVEWLAVKP